MKTHLFDEAELSKPAKKILDALEEGAIEEEGDEDAETPAFLHKKKGPQKMPKAAVAEVEVDHQKQLATRLNAKLFRIMKLHVVKQDISVMEFVHNAITHELQATGGLPKKGKA
jgi:protoporphyrinogen oxidase